LRNAGDETMSRDDTAQSYRGRYERPRVFYILKSERLTDGGNSIYKIGGTTKTADERCFVLNNRGPVFDWVVTWECDHPLPFHAETLTLRLLKRYKVRYTECGRDVGQEVVACKDERVLFGAAVDALFAMYGEHYQRTDGITFEQQLARKIDPKVREKLIDYMLKHTSPRPQRLQASGAPPHHSEGV